MEKLTQEQILEHLAKLHDWHYGEVGILFKDYVFNDFKQAMMFVNKVANAAELLGHHPDIELYDYNNVTLTLTTHDVDGVSVKDVELAKAINLIKVG
jgi:4a-hydroxytetrahydrobiopterin dehydratase